MEQLLFLALFVAIGLFNVIGRWLKRKMEEQARQNAPPEPPVGRVPPIEVPERPARRLRMPAPPPEEGVMPAVRVPARRAAVRGAARIPSRLGGQADLRRAIVLMSVLGPCRALDRDGPDAVR